jgi:hypothetical protein
MKKRSACRCLLCKLERHLMEHLGEPGHAEAYRRLAGSSPLVSAFPTILALTAHLRTCRNAGNGDHPADPILIALLHARQRDETDGLLRDALLLAFIPALHSTWRQIAGRYPSLCPDDIAQHLVASLLEVLGSAELRERVSHLAFVISRMLKRSMFDWAEREARSPSRPGGEHFPDTATALGVAEPFEREVLLRHFLFRCQREGLLTGTDLELLVQFKLDGNVDEEHGGSAVCSNALRQRTKRLLQKLRRAARTPGPTVGNPHPTETA